MGKTISVTYNQCACRCHVVCGLAKDVSLQQINPIPSPEGPLSKTVPSLHNAAANKKVDCQLMLSILQKIRLGCVVAWDHSSHFSIQRRVFKIEMDNSQRLERCFHENEKKRIESMASLSQ